MYIILLSGGSGKRLWPLSNDVRSKQFIKIFKKPEAMQKWRSEKEKPEDVTGKYAGGQAEEIYESMLQRVYRQIKTVDKDATVTIATSKSQVSAIHNQLGNDVGIRREYIYKHANEAELDI